AVVVFTTPAGNAFMAKPMQILLRHAGKTPPPAGKPGIFSLGAPGVLERLFTEGGYADVEQRTMTVPLRMASAAQALEMMREAFGAYRAVVSDQPESVQTAAWAEVVQMLKGMESATGFEASAELLVAAATRPA
ncbi:MAG: SAM-dependent methyltransferase, partial [Hylemonella sp.]|nr:SAM-dependent methyltransferase [Hylemonella sp.]